MIYLYWIVGSIGYAVITSWTFGYMKGVMDDKSGLESPIPLFSSLCWPLTIVIIMTYSSLNPISNIGFKFHQRQLEKQKLRIAEQKQLRIQLKELEDELEMQEEIPSFLSKSA